MDDVPTDRGDDKEWKRQDRGNRACEHERDRLGPPLPGRASPRGEKAQRCRTRGSFRASGALLVLLADHEANLRRRLTAPQGRQTAVTQQLPLEHAKVIEGSAEHAGALKAADNHAVALDRHVEEIPVLDTEHLSVLGRDDHTAEVIDASSDAPRSLYSLTIGVLRAVDSGLGPIALGRLFEIWTGVVGHRL